MKRRIVTIYLVYGKEHLETGLEVLNVFMQKNFFDFEQRVLVVDNKAASSYIFRENKIVMGNNDCREFSGWDKGIEYIIDDLNDKDIVCLVNDTFHRNYGKDYLDCFDYKKLQKTLKVCGCAGYIDGYPKKIDILGSEMQTWFRSSFILLNMNLLKKVLPLNRKLQFNRIFSSEKMAFLDSNKGISDNYIHYLKKWLFNNTTDPDFKENWHGHDCLSEDNYNLMREKTNCIFSEHYLSVQLKKHTQEVYSVSNVKKLI